MPILVERAPSIQEFSALSGSAAGSFAEWVVERASDGETRPDLWFVARDEADAVVARCGFCVSELEPEVGRMFGLRFAAGVDDTDREQFLEESSAVARGDGLRTLEVRVYSTSEDHERVRASLSASRYEERQEKVRLERAADAPEPNDGRICFRAVEDVGRAAYVDAIMRVTRDTLDRLDGDEVHALGAHEAAALTFDSLREMHAEDGWWELAYDDADELVGLIVPQVLDGDMGVINYIGVVPEQRGRGYVDDLLARGTWRASAGATRVVAETDVENAPMLAALARHGYAEASRMWHLVRA